MLIRSLAAFFFCPFVAFCLCGESDMMVLIVTGQQQQHQQEQQLSRWSLSGPPDHNLGQEAASTNELELTDGSGHTASSSFGLLANGGSGGHLPSIDRGLTPRNITKQLGATVYLHCYVRNIGQKTVSAVHIV